MNWKTRQLFSDREHGIVSGLSPVNMMGGGTVPIPGYKTGGGVEYAPTAQSIPVSAYNREEGSAFINTGQTEEPSIEQQVAALAAQQGISVPEARAMILTQMIQEKGVTLPEEVINQFATGLITLQDALSQAQAVGGGVGRAVGPGMGGGVGRAVGPGIPGMQDGGVAFTGMSFDEAYNLMQALTKDPTMSVSDADKAQMERAFFLGGEEHIFYQLAKGTNYQPSSQFKNIVKESIPKMQAGTGLGEAMSIDLFQQGDQDINEPLNIMAQAVSPSIADITPTETPTEIGEAVGEETALMDQGSGEYEVELQGIKKQFEELLRRYATKLAEANGTIEQLIEQAKAVEIAFSNKVTEIQAKHNIEGLDETLLTEEFMQELTALIDPTIPGMQKAGVVHSQEELIAAQKLLSELGMNISPQRFLDLPEAQRKKFINAFTILAANRGITSSSVGDRTKLDELIEERRGLAGEIGEAARSGYSSVQDPVSHFFSARKAGKTAELGAREKMIADEIAAEQALLSATSRYGGASSMGRLPAALIEDIYGDTGDLSAAYEDMIDALKKGGKQADLGLVDVMFMERYQQMPSDQTAYQGTKTIQNQTVTFPQFYALTRNQIINKLDKEPTIDYEARKIEALRRIFTLWINAA